MTLTDQFGLEMSATDAADIARHDRLVDGYLMFEADMVDRMAETLAKC